MLLPIYKRRDKSSGEELGTGANIVEGVVIGWSLVLDITESIMMGKDGSTLVEDAARNSRLSGDPTNFVDHLSLGFEVRCGLNTHMSILILCPLYIQITRRR